MKFKFEKFMKDIVQKEDDAKTSRPEEKNVTPQRKFNKLVLAKKTFWSSKSATVFIEKQLSLFEPKIILNQVRSQRDQLVGPSMKEACSKYFKLNLKFMGYLTEDDSVRKSVLEREPLAVTFPDGVPMQQLKTICSDILQEESERAVKNNLLSQLAL